MSMTLIEKRVIASNTSSIEFTGIPQFYTDLVIKASIRCTRSDFALGSLSVRLNSVSTGYSTRWLRRNETENVVSSSLNSNSNAWQNVYTVPGPTITSNVFGNIEFYIPNYTSGTSKSASSDGVGENNAATNSSIFLAGHLSNVTVPVTSIQTFTDGDFVAGSTISLYGINRQQAIGRPKAVGGAITFGSGYWYHTFTGSGTFYAQESLNIDALVIAGGGAGGSYYGGGGGSGGVSFRASKTISPGSFLVTIGSGGSGSGAVPLAGANGNDSFFDGITSIGGGGGGSWFSSVVVAGKNGGAGGGGPMGVAAGNTGAAGSSNQGSTGGATGFGNSGGSGYRGSTGTAYRGGGGGGAGSAGTSTPINNDTSPGSNGGSGLSTWSSWAQTTSTGQNGFYAGGGGGGVVSGTPGQGGAGGGGNGDGGGGNPTAGAINTGSGGGADTASGLGAAAGASGIVIIRYPAS
jgi:hypothetical protein